MLYCIYVKLGSDSKLNRDVAMNSTDEDNWRNDYPDEEGSTHTSDSELDDCGGYRHRQARYSMFPNWFIIYLLLTCLSFSTDSDEDYRFDDYLWPHTYKPSSFSLFTINFIPAVCWPKITHSFYRMQVYKTRRTTVYFVYAHAHVFTMAARVVQLLTVAVSLTSLLPPCSSCPLDQRHQRLEILLQKGVGAADSSEILCHLCEVWSSLLATDRPHFTPLGPYCRQRWLWFKSTWRREAQWTTCSRSWSRSVSSSWTRVLATMVPTCVQGWFTPMDLWSAHSHCIHILCMSTVAKVSQCVTFNYDCSVSLHSSSVCF